MNSDSLNILIVYGRFTLTFGSACVVDWIAFIGTKRYREAPRRYPYFDVVVGLAWSHDPKSYAGGSICYW
jgi:hypothetical protein